jgi:hypothetical protein
MKWGKAERKGERREGRKQLQQRSIRCFSHASMKQLLLDGLVVMIRLSHSRERGSIPRRGKYFFCFFVSLLFRSLPSPPLYPASTLAAWKPHSSLHRHPYLPAECVERENSFRSQEKRKPTSCSARSLFVLASCATLVACRH